MDAPPAELVQSWIGQCSVGLTAKLCGCLGPPMYTPDIPASSPMVIIPPSWLQP